MPIRPERRALYPPKPEWAAIRARILARAGDCCEGSPRFPSCRAKNGEPHPVTGSQVILTIAHWPDPEPGNVSEENLHAWCQRCHLLMDLHIHQANAKRTRAAQRRGAQVLALPLEEP